MCDETEREAEDCFGDGYEFAKDRETASEEVEGVWRGEGKSIGRNKPRMADGADVGCNVGVGRVQEKLIIA